jgi:hypothetical protein
MRFERARAAALAESFAISPAFNRQPTAQGERAAVERVAASFEEAGYQASLEEIACYPGAKLCRTFGSWGVFASAPGLVAVRLVNIGMSLKARVVVTASALAWLIISPSACKRIGRILAFKSWNVVAHRPGVAAAPVRVVFVTALDNPGPVLASRRAKTWRWTALVLFPLMMSLIFGYERLPPLLAGIVVLSVTLLFWYATCVGFITTRVPLGTGPMDNRDGLAALVELARTWSTATDRWVETRFVAAGDQTGGLGGLTALVRKIREVGPDRPTLVVGLWSPGLGDRLTLFSPERGTERLARAAAEGLWLPHRVARDFTIRTDLWPFGGKWPEFVALIGGAPGSKAQTIDPEAMRRATQLAAEIALRWARQAKADLDRAQVLGESLARSSQNPG